MENMVGIRKGMFAMRALVIIFFAVLMLAGTAMGEIPRNGLVGEWHFDGDAKDSSGNGNDGVVHGANFVDGKFGKALSFNGVDNYVDIGNNPNLKFSSGTFTIEAWINFVDDDTQPSIVSYGDYSYGFYIGRNGLGGTPEHFLCWAKARIVNDDCYSSSSETAVSPNNWYHVVAVNTIGNDIKYYINGNFVKTRAFAYTYSYTKNLRIGSSDSEGMYFKGSIDEVRIYNRALRADELKAIYESGQIIITSSPSGAEVLIDNQSKEYASPTLTISGIAPGSHAVKCKLSGYSDYDTTAVVTAGATTSVTCSMSQSNGNISIFSSPIGAESLVDGASKGSAPVTIQNVPPGSHAVKCKLSGYSDYDITANVTAGATSSITCSMSQSTGNISISSSPTGAEVLVDGASKGSAPVTVPNVPPGSHAVKCKLSGYADNDNSATVTAGSTSSVICSLTPIGELSVKLTSEPASIQPGQISTIKISVTKDDTPVSGVNIMLSSTSNVKFSPSSGTTTNGEFISTFTPSTEGEIKVSALAKKEGIKDGKGEAVVQVGKITPPNTSKLAAITGKVMDALTDDPVQDVTITVDGKSAVTGSNGEYELSVDVGKHNLSASKQGYKAMTRSVIVLEEGTVFDLSLKPVSGDTSWFWIGIILLIVVVAAVIFLFYRKKNPKVEEKKKVVATNVEKKKFCMFCHAPMPYDAEFCPKCGKKQDETKRFCMNCGALMHSVPELCSKCSKMPPSDMDTKNCKNCGEVIPKVAKFCSACGAGQPE